MVVVRKSDFRPNRDQVELCKERQEQRTSGRLLQEPVSPIYPHESAGRIYWSCVGEDNVTVDRGVLPASVGPRIRLPRENSELLQLGWVPSLT